MVMEPWAGSFAFSVPSAFTDWMPTFSTEMTSNGKSPADGVAVKSPPIVTEFIVGVTSTFAPENANIATTQSTTTTRAIPARRHGKERFGRPMLPIEDGRGGSGGKAAGGW